MYMMTPDSFESWIFGEEIYKPNIEQIDKYFVLSLSGGKDSTALFLKCLDYDIWIDEVIYADTGVEFDEMEIHINEMRGLANDNDIKFTILKPEKSFEYYLGNHIKTKGKNKGKKGYGWPDFKNRWCTGNLKQKVVKEYYKKLKSEYETVEMIGYAADEIRRVEKNQDGRIKEFYLVDWDITEKEALKYCYNKGYTWNGLYRQLDRVSCYLCPLSKLSELKFVFENKPHLWLKMEMIDKKSFRRFRGDYSLEELKYKFIGEIYQKLFKIKQMKLF